MLSWLFTWWNSSTFGTQLTLFKRGARLVGRDEQGNRYYEEKKASAAGGEKRRWVIYHGIAEASRVPADWHGWLHHMIEEPPTSAPLPRKSWEREHLPNMTGTPLAYRPAGSLARRGGPGVGEGYEAWTPENAG
jgi:NADH:ubiquinone oxidoreductase subunit